MSSPALTSEAVPCALCEHPGVREPGGDRVHYTVHCPCCGTFELSDAVSVLLDALPTRMRRALCAACVAQMPRDGAVRITIQNVAQLVAPYL